GFRGKSQRWNAWRKQKLFDPKQIKTMGREWRAQNQQDGFKHSRGRGEGAMDFKQARDITCFAGFEWC
ncbi:hypothetical protein E2562_008230, partial [Oryza meyeriana var. granulata]